MVSIPPQPSLPRMKILTAEGLRAFADLMSPEDEGTVTCVSSIPFPHACRARLVQGLFQMARNFFSGTPF